MSALGNPTSQSFQADAYEQFSKDKLFILNRFLSKQPNTPSLATLRIEAESGIVSWAAKMALTLNASSPVAIKLWKQAEELENKLNAPPKKARVIKGALSLDSFKCAQMKEHSFSTLFKLPKKILLKKICNCFCDLLISYTKHRHIHKKTPFSNRIKQSINLIFNHCKLIQNPKALFVFGGEQPYGYLAKATFSKDFKPSLKRNYWIKIHLKAHAGVIGICIMKDENIEKEKNFPACNEDVVSYFPIQSFTDSSIIVRNLEQPKSLVAIYDLSLIEDSPLEQEEE